MFYIYLYVTKICTNSGKPINVYDFSSPLQSELGRRSQQGRDLDKSGDPNKYRNCVCRYVRDEFFPQAIPVLSVMFWFGMFRIQNSFFDAFDWRPSLPEDCVLVFLVLSLKRRCTCIGIYVYILYTHYNLSKSFFVAYTQGHSRMIKTDAWKKNRMPWKRRAVDPENYRDLPWLSPTRKVGHNCRPTQRIPCCRNYTYLQFWTLFFVYWDSFHVSSLNVSVFVVIFFHPCPFTRVTFRCSAAVGTQGCEYVWAHGYLLHCFRTRASKVEI